MHCPHCKVVSLCQNLKCTGILQSAVTDVARFAFTVHVLAYLTLVSSCKMCAFYDSIKSFKP